MLYLFELLFLSALVILLGLYHMHLLGPDFARLLRYGYLHDLELLFFLIDENL